MHLGRTTLSKFLIQQLNGIAGAQDLGALLVDVAAAVKAISAMTAKGALGGYLGEHGGQQRAGRGPAEARRAGARDDDPQLRVGRPAGRHGFRGTRGALSRCRWNSRAAATCWCSIRSTARPTPTSTSRSAPSSRCCGTQRASRPPPATTCSRDCKQVAAGYAIYGPATMLVITRRQGHARLHARSRDRQLHPHAPGPADSRRHQRVRDQYQQCALLGAAGAALRDRMSGRQERRARRDFNMRWIASMVAEVHRILMRGGVFMYPQGHQGPHAARDACACCTRPIRSASWSSRPAAAPAPAVSACWSVKPETPAPAHAADPRLTQRGRAHRALPRRVGERCRPPVHLAAVQRALAVPARGAPEALPGTAESRPTMSIRHPIIAVTGSSGAGTTTVMKSFAHIFRREGIKAQVIEGDSFHRYNRKQMRERVAAADDGSGQPQSVISDRRRTCWPNSPAPSRSTARAARGRVRRYVHDAGEVQGAQRRGRHLHRLAADDGRQRSAVLRGAARRLCRRRGRRRAPRRSAGRRGADHQPRVDPEAASRPHPPRLLVRMRWSTPILRRMPDYVNHICPQFSRTHVNFQRVPTVDTQQPVHRARHPVRG